MENISCYNKYAYFGVKKQLFGIFDSTDAFNILLLMILDESTFRQCPVRLEYAEERTRDSNNEELCPNSEILGGSIDK